MQILKIRTAEFAAAKGIDIICAGCSIHHVSAPVGQLPNSRRPGAHARQIKHANGMSDYASLL